MARRGIFGRVPRAAPDLTNTIVSLVREANAMEDSNYIDAWKNGGKVDGKGVDDTRLLDHMKMRRDQLDKDDPAWDEWNNRVAQYDFSINESKVNLKFDQKKMTEQQVADFYGKWVARPEIQQDSEFYRHLLDQQAKWHQAAVQGNGSRGRANAAEAHNKWVTGILKDKIQPASDATSYILQIAQEYDAAPAGATSLDQVFENSKGWGRVMDIIDDGKSDDPYIQGLINQATTKIQGQMGKDWKWNKGSIDALMNNADSGYKTLIKGSKSPTEKNKWTKDKHNNDYEQARVRHAAASKDIADAADHWAEDLDNCNGDAYCARQATKTYLDRLKKNAPNIIGGQSGVKPGTEDVAQSQMLIATIGQLGDIVDGKPVQTTTGAAARMIGAAGGGTPDTAKDLTQADAIVGNRSPADFLGNMGNMMNDDIRKLDAGGWVSSEPNIDPKSGAQQMDGAGNPAYHLVTHEPTEVPDPGLVPIKGTITMNDPTRVAQPDPLDGGGPKPHSVTPVQWVAVTPVPVVTVTEGGDPVSGDGVVGTKMVNGKPDPAATPQQKPAAGYSVVSGVLGPDGNPHTMYRTGDGSKGNEFRYMTEPPVALGTKTQRDPKTGAMVPVLTAHPITGPDGKTGMVYDTNPLTDGIAKATRPLQSGNLPLGTFKTTGAAATAQSINAVFANGNTPAAVAKANQLLGQYTKNVNNLPATDPDRINSANDLNQLNQTVQLHAGGKFGQTVDDNYTTINDRTPAQMAYEKQLASGGFVEGKNGITREDVGQRISLLEQIDAADKRVAARAGPATGIFNPQDPYGVGRAVQNADIDAITKAKRDILNPTISVSNIKVPGFDPMMQNAPPNTPGTYAADVAAHGLGYVPPPGTTPIKPPVAPPVPGVKQGPPVAGAKAGGGDTGLDAAPPTPPKPLMTGVQPGTGKAADDLITPPPALPKLSAAAELRRQKEQRNAHGALEF